MDESVFNAARIWKLYGTKACKGENHPERPHRLSKILSVPEEIKTVTKEQLIELGNLAPVPEEPNSNKSPIFNIDKWINKFRLSVKNSITKNNRVTYVLDNCPFDSSHKDASITQMDNGALAFNCFHNSCKDNHWKQLRLKFEPYAYSSEYSKAVKVDNSTTYNQSSALIQYTKLPGVELFHDEKKEPYARLPIDGKNVIVPVGGRDFRRWLTRSFFTDTGTAPGSDALTSALGVIEAVACYTGKEHELSNRVASHDGAIWYDLGSGEAVKISAGKWELVKEPPILFRRQTHQKAHDSGKIKQNGDMKKVLEFVNVQSDPERLLFLVYLISCFVPEIPHPIPVLYGDKGSSKTTALKMVKEIVDPSVLQIISFPHNNQELVQKLYHHYLAPFDNIADLSEGQSDALCRACTGEGVSKRALFTNEEDVIFNYRRCVALNGVNLVADKPDLLDRSILLKMERISKEKRKTEDKVWKNFNEVKGEILGGIFDTLAKAIVIKPNIHLDELPRMADFMEWGCAISEALGTGMEAFKAAYLGNIRSQNKEAIDASPIGDVILKFVEDGFQIKNDYTLDVGKETSWKGSATELLTLLEDCAIYYGMNIKLKSWPKTANILTRRLNEIKTNLQEEGILFDARRDSSGDKRILSLCQLQGNIVRIVRPSETISGDASISDDIPKSNRQNIVSKNPSDDISVSSDDIKTNISSDKNHDAGRVSGRSDDSDAISLRYGEGTNNTPISPVTGTCGICNFPLDGDVVFYGHGLGYVHNKCLNNELAPQRLQSRLIKAKKQWEIQKGTLHSDNIVAFSMWFCDNYPPKTIDPVGIKAISQKLFKLIPDK